MNVAHGGFDACEVSQVHFKKFVSGRMYSCGGIKFGMIGVSKPNNGVTGLQELLGDGEAEAARDSGDEGEFHGLKAPILLFINISFPTPFET